MANVLLLRTPSQDSQDSSDRYELHFQSLGYNVLSVPVLETVYTNLDELKRVVLDGPDSQNYGGVIITSRRACEAWKDVVKDLTESSAEITNPGVNWSSVPFYVVGKATASVLAEICDLYGRSHLAPKDIRGESSGTGENLARFILADIEREPTKLLYLTGDKNRDTLPKILHEGDVELRQLQVYETRGSSSFPRQLEDSVNLASRAFERWWIVFFAPSAAEFALPTLRNFFHLHIPGSSNDLGPAVVPKVAAIGPTTSAFLQDSLNLRVDVVSPKPTPADLVAAIVGHDDRSFRLTHPNLQES